METEDSKKICEFCDSTATCLCFRCRNYYCDQCYKFIHDKTKNSGHKKEEIDPFVPIDLKCPEHPEHPVYLFCADEKGKLIYSYFYLRNLLHMLLL